MVAKSRQFVNGLSREILHLGINTIYFVIHVKVASHMFDLIKDFFGAQRDERSPNEGEAPVHDVRVATCALLLEMAHIDGVFSDVERRQLFSVMKNEYGLTHDIVEELAEAAQTELENSLDLWKFTHLINKHYSKKEKVRVVEMIWEIVYADGKLDKHEDYLVHKFATLLGIAHEELIAAKLRAKNKEGGPTNWE